MIYEYHENFNFNSLNLLFFYTSWSSNCSFNERLLLDISKKIPNLNIVKVNVSKFYHLKKEYNILKIPTYILVKDNNVLSKFIGGINLKYLLEWIYENM